AGCTAPHFPDSHGKFRHVSLDSRVFPRIPVHLKVTYRDGAELQSSMIESLSQGGVFIRTARPLPIGTEILMEIEVESDSEGPVLIRGRVVWERLIGRADGMGVKFLEPVPERLKKVLTDRVA